MIVDKITVQMDAVTMRDHFGSALVRSFWWGVRVVSENGLTKPNYISTIYGGCIGTLSTGPFVWLDQQLTQLFAGAAARALSRAQPTVDVYHIHGQFASALRGEENTIRVENHRV